jgi:hypothetical protein
MALGFSKQDDVIDYIIQRLTSENMTVYRNMFQNPPLCRLGQVTNGPCEQLHNAIRMCREKPVCSMILDMLQIFGDWKRAQYSDATARYSQFQNDRTLIRLALTPFVVKVVLNVFNFKMIAC